MAEVEANAGQPDVGTVILTSGLGQHFGYTLPTPALAKRHSAPVLLTAPGELPSAVATFLARPAITTVYLVGNEDVVSAAVEAAVAAIEGVTVNRIADVGTAVDAAVAIAGLVGWTPGSPGRSRAGAARRCWLPARTSPTRSQPARLRTAASTRSC